MIALATNRRLLKLVCACSEDDSTSILEKRFHFFFALVVIVTNLCAAAATAIFFLQHMSNDLAASLYGLSLFVAFASAVCIYVFALQNRRGISELFEDLDEIYARNALDERFRFLTQANQKSEQITRLYIKYLQMTTSLTLIGFTIISVLLCTFRVGHFDRDVLYIPYAFVLPWHQNSPLGYLAEILFSFLAAATYFSVVVPMVGFFISLCLHHWAFYEMFNHSISKLGNPERRTNDKIILCDLIELHITAKNWFYKCTDVYSRIVLVQLLYSMLFSATELFQMDLALQHIDFMIVILLWSTAACALNSVLYCYFGRMATESYAQMANCMFESNWLNLPIDVKKMLIVMIGNAQIPIVFHGYRIAVFNLETLAKVAKMVITYYMAIRTITLME